GLGSAKSGTHHWWVQKLTSLALIPLALWFMVSMAMLASADYGAIIIWVKAPLVTVFLVLFITILFYHLKLGVQVVIEDYVYKPVAKALSLFFNAAFAYVFGLLAIVSILRIALGS
ncbi:MAG TPA: succinate dehydrogenase, hydrophobic membrane anchor protein, partial [Sphingomonadales bacterium]|nr:succinate dehydrogenase, hydrophobic membrane anchor protein [Sphingomonadales bacterium]